MSYEPTQQPDSGYGTPPYGAPQDPYGTPPQNPYGTPPQQGPYSAPQNPYGAPQNPYGTPPQGPYTPPQQGPYGAPPQGVYGAPVYQQQGYGYPPPAAAPLPLGEAIRQLPSQYIRVLTKPSAGTFAEEMGKAAWNIVWVQLLGLAIAVGVLVVLLFQLLLPSLLRNGNVPAATIAVFEGSSLAIALGEVVLIPVGFFIGMGIYYLIAKAFGGQGTFLAQSYTTLLFTVPLGILSILISFIPFVGGLVGTAIAVYQIVLNTFSIMAVHRLSGGKATLVVLLPAIVALVLSIVLVVIIVGIIAGAARPA